MMHGPEKSDPAIVATKPTNKAEGPPVARPAGETHAAEPVERRAGTKGNADQQSTCRTCHKRWNAYGKWQSPTLPSHTRGGSRMRESRTSGSVRGACDETHVPTATQLRRLLGRSEPAAA